MKRLVFLTSVVLWAAIGWAQQAPRGEVFGGYSFLRIDTQGVTGQSLDALCNLYAPGTCPAGTFKVHPNFNGWNAAAQFNVNSWLGLKGDFSGHHGTPLTLSSEAQSVISGLGVSGFPPKATLYNFLFGPVGYRSVGRYRPFVHALFGTNQLHTGTVSIDAIVLGTPIHTSAHVSDSTFAMALGGGLDWKAGAHVLVRVAQADYLYTKHDFSFGVPGIATHQNNVRVSAGIVYVFGGQGAMARTGGSEPRTGAADTLVPALGLRASPTADDAGATISGLIPGGSAELCGLRLGDVINAIDGKQVKSPMELAAAVADRSSGTKVVLSVRIRGQWQSDTAVILGPSPTSK
jgi:opacity protein-like surface antigen